MNAYLSRDEIGLLLLIDRLKRRERPLGRESVLRLAEIKLPGVAEHLSACIAALFDRGLLCGDAEVFALTPRGEHELARTAAAHSLYALSYDAYYEAAQDSAAHALFCERAYGLNLCQHGIADVEQVQVLIDELAIDSTTSLLDFGCGDGRITEYVAHRTGAPASGIDISSKAIALAQARTAPEANWLRFYCGDILTRSGSLPPGPFERITAIDSLFFLPDQRAALQALLAYLAPGGRIGVFYLSWEDIGPAGTPLGAALAELRLPYRVRDLTAEGTAHWQRKREILVELEDAFIAEGSGYLFRNRLADCAGPPPCLRCLYLIAPAG
jgi:SAM-dependent methyltransferase